MVKRWHFLTFILWCAERTTAEFGVGYTVITLGNSLSNNGSW
jgi:hypothetical protein